MIYLDQCSTSFPKARGVGDAMKTFLEDAGVNVGRGNYGAAYDVEADVLDTRERIGRLIGHPNPRGILFTSGVTESMNVFFYGYLMPGDHVVVGGMEHNAVMRPLTHLQRLRDIRYTVAETDACGFTSAEAVERAMEDDTKAVVISHASNVSGTIQPIAEIGALCRDRGIVFAVDAAQSCGALPIDMEAMHIGFLGFTGHKSLLGPHGTGGFGIDEELAARMEPLLVGGTGSRSDSFDQPGFLPDKFESGTQNLPGIMGLRAALMALESEGMEARHDRAMALTARFLEGVRAIPGVVAVGYPNIEGRTAVVSVDVPAMDNARVAFELEQGYDIMVRVGLHCAPLAHKTLGTFPRGTIRFSFGPSNTEAEIDTALNALEQTAR
ncbi:MAG: aminotransferase class V-fold PLP-dependent enzyme [Saccharofermentanales bacterium]|jgi:cysteine desulfurase family protein